MWVDQGAGPQAAGRTRLLGDQGSDVLGVTSLGFHSSVCVCVCVGAPACVSVAELGA